MTLTFPATCTTFAPCGGNLPGTYVYTAGCVEDAEFAPVLNALSFCGTNVVTVSNKSGTIQGSLTFTASQVSRAATGGLSFTLTIGGSTCANMVACNQIQGALTSFGASGTCALGSTGTTCICNVTRPWSNTTNESYVAAANQINVAGASTTKVYDYCVTNGGAKLEHHEVTDAGTTYIRDPGHFTLAK